MLLKDLLWDFQELRRPLDRRQEPEERKRTSVEKLASYHQYLNMPNSLPYQIKPSLYIFPCRDGPTSTLPLAVPDCPSEWMSPECVVIKAKDSSTIFESSLSVSNPAACHQPVNADYYGPSIALKYWYIHFSTPFWNHPSPSNQINNWMILMTSCLCVSISYFVKWDRMNTVSSFFIFYDYKSLKSRSDSG